MFFALFKQYISRTLLLFSVTASYPLLSETTDFQVFGCKKNGGQIEYYSYVVKGIERTNYGLNRLSILSENQENYPTPETGCGPTAMLNILIWYEKFGLIPPLYRDADTRLYKLKLFHEIDHRLARQSGTIRTEERGIRNLDTAIVMDSIVNERTAGKVRIQTDWVKAPLSLNDFLETIKSFRAGYLIVAPKDLETGELLDDHAAVVIRTDRTGYITLATWGQHYHGRLKKRADEQWFIPRDSSHMELKIKALMRFIPFNPEEELEDGS